MLDASRDERELALFAFANLVAHLAIERLPLRLRVALEPELHRDLVALGREVGEVLARVPQLEMRTARTLSLFDGAAQERTFDGRAVAQHAAVVHEGQRHGEGAEYPAPEEHERQHTRKLTASLGCQVFRLVAEGPADRAEPTGTMVRAPVRMPLDVCVTDVVRRVVADGDRWIRKADAARVLHNSSR